MARDAQPEWLVTKIAVDAIQEGLLELGMTHEELGRKVDLTKQAIGKILALKRQPRVDL